MKMSSYAVYHPTQQMNSVTGVQDVNSNSVYRTQSDDRLTNMTTTGRKDLDFYYTNLFGGLEDNFLSLAEAIVHNSSDGQHKSTKHEALYGPATSGAYVDYANHSGTQYHYHPNAMPRSPIHGFNHGDASPPAKCMSQGYGFHGLDQSSGHLHHQQPSMVYSGTKHHHSVAESEEVLYNMAVQSYHCSPNHHQVQQQARGEQLEQPVPATIPTSTADPRELEAFAEHFKLRRIKLGATQADVGTALGNLKIPGVGSLSQSTVCRFESLTLSHNNMVALRPVLHAWLDEAEAKAAAAASAAVARESNRIQSGGDARLRIEDRKRKRTSIAAPEKRSLEAYFAIQPRPSGERMVQIADKLDLTKNVVRVWFCNQRQKQKRLKFSSVGGSSQGQF